MKTKRYLIAGLAGMLLAACTGDVALEDKATQKYGLLKVEVIDGLAASATRAEYSGFPVTTFEEDDAIGVYAFNGTSYIASNVKYTRQADGSWETEGRVPFNAGYTYYAYFPWRETVYSPSTSGTVDAVDTKFDSFISDASGYFWQADQSTKAGFTYSNLMIAKGTFTDAENLTVKFTMAHKRGLAIFDGNGATTAAYTGNTPYKMGDKKYFLMKPSLSTSFTDFSGTYSLSAPAGEYTTHTLTLPDYLQFIPTESTAFSFSKGGLSYSLDGGATWTALAAGANTPTVGAGKPIMWKNNTTLTPASNTGIGTFSSTATFDAEGNIMSLYYGDSYEGQTSLSGKGHAFEYLFNNSMIRKADKLLLPATTLEGACYQGMFQNCTSLITAPELPATTIPTDSYYQMFNNCSSLTEAPELPAKDLGVSCYCGMFQDCTSLTTAPELPATTIPQDCYSDMFNGCTALVTAPELPATTLASNCYLNMFQNCTSLTTAPELPALTMEIACYNYMFDGCTSLVTAPKLPARTLANYCYSNMFSGCTSLTTAPKLPATTLVTQCYSNMFAGCSALTATPKLPATTLAEMCYAGMFQNCTSLTTALELPATTLAQYCYQAMFTGCTALKSVPEKMLPATTLQNYCYIGMFNGCSSLVAAPELPATTLVSQCYNYMFQNCSSLNYVKAAFTTTPSMSYTRNWLYRTANSGTFYKNSTAAWTTTGQHGVPSGWTVETYAP